MGSWLAENWPALTLTSIGILAGGVIAHLYHILAKKEKRPLYAVRSLNVIKNSKAKLPHLIIHYQGYGEDLDNFSVTYLLVWNSGKETIAKKDIAEPFKIAIKSDYKLIDAVIIATNKAANQITCTLARIINLRP
jgi:hypothetical protein